MSVRVNQNEQSVVRKRPFIVCVFKSSPDAHSSASSCVLFPSKQ